jgi:TM2 domain-containing membrane protein YozV
MKRWILYIIIFGIIILPICSAAHYILGTVEDARDGMKAENHTIFLWNPVIGTEDNLTDIIGLFGNS